MKTDLEASIANFHQWNNTGRMGKGELHDICINDRKKFPGQEEVEMDFDVHDGFAVGNYRGREYLMVYPLMAQVRNNPSMMNKVELTVGSQVLDETGLEPHDIALAYGKICGSCILPMNLKDNDMVFQLNMKITDDEAAEIINSKITKLINGTTASKNVEPYEIPSNEDCIVENGYLVVRENGQIDFWEMPKNKKETEDLLLQALDAMNFDSLESLDRMIKATCKYDGITDVKVKCGENNQLAVSCKVYGVQMPDKVLTGREVEKYNYYEKLHAHEADRKDSILLAIGYNGLMKKYQPELEQAKDIFLYRKANTYGSNPEWMVRCTIHGEQQLGRELPKHINENLNKLTRNGNGQVSKDIWNELAQYVAYSQYNDVIRNQQQEQTKGLKR